MSDPAVMEQQPAGGNPMSPASGTYGERAELDRLEQALPLEEAAPAEAGPLGLMPEPATGGGGGGATGVEAAPPPMFGEGDGDLPGGIFAPTAQPDVPIQTPLTQEPINPVAAQQTAAMERIALLDALSRDPMVSDETREWAGMVVGQLASRGS